MDKPKRFIRGDRVLFHCEKIDGDVAIRVLSTFDNDQWIVGERYANSFVCINVNQVKHISVLEKYDHEHAICDIAAGVEAGIINAEAARETIAVIIGTKSVQMMVNESEGDASQVMDVLECIRPARVGTGEDPNAYERPCKWLEDLYTQIEDADAVYTNDEQERNPEADAKEKADDAKWDAYHDSSDYQPN